jgi:hypothetical protein
VKEPPVAVPIARKGGEKKQGSVGKAGWIGMKKLPVAVSIARRAENLVFSASLSNHSLNDFSSFKRKKEDEAKHIIITNTLLDAFHSETHKFPHRSHYSL